jgi:hypothetical protein
MKVAESFLELKNELAQRLLCTDDEEMVRKIAELMGDELDWYDKLSDEDKEDIRLGGEDIEAGRLISQEDLIAASRTWKQR